jgi:hypothetical protein
VVMYIIYIVLFCMHANHVSVSHFIRANHGVECEVTSTIGTPSIFGKSFSFGKECIGPTC